MHDEDTPEAVKIGLTDEQERLLAWALEFTANNTFPGGFLVGGEHYDAGELTRIRDQLGLPDSSLGEAGKRLAIAARVELAGDEVLADILHTEAAAADVGYPLPYVTAAGEEAYADGEALRMMARRMKLKVTGDIRRIDPPPLSPDQVCMLTAALERASQVTGDPELEWELRESVPDAFAQTGPLDVRAVQKALGIARAPVPKQEHEHEARAASDAAPGV